MPVTAVLEVTAVLAEQDLTVVAVVPAAPAHPVLPVVWAGKVAPVVPLS